MKPAVLRLMIFLSAVLMSTLAAAATTTATSPDNSARNKVDAEGTTITPADQAKGSEADVETTRRIREALMKERELSTYARNIKIITLGGKTVLRGPVATQAEKDKVDVIARAVVGNAVENHLTISQ